MSLTLDIASWICLIIGALLMVVSAIGLLRLPDLFTRLHSGGLADTGGAALLLLGMALQTDFDLVTVKIVLIGIVLVLTSPTASHAVAHSALLGGLSPSATEANQAGDESDKENT